MKSQFTFYCWGGSLHGKTYTLPDIRPLAIKLTSSDPTTVSTANTFPEPLPWWKNKILNLIGVKPVVIHYGQQDTIEERYLPFRLRYRECLLNFLVCDACEQSFRDMNERCLLDIYIRHKDEIGEVVGHDYPYYPWNLAAKE